MKKYIPILFIFALFSCATQPPIEQAGYQGAYSGAEVDSAIGIADSVGAIDGVVECDGSDNCSGATALTHEIGGLEADVSAYSGLVGINSGTTAEIDTAGELESYAGLGAFFSDYADDADASTMRTTLGVAIGSDVQAYDGTLGTLSSGLTDNYIWQGDSSDEPEAVNTLSLEITGGDSDTASSAAYWDASKILQSSSTVSSTELGYLDGVTSAIQTQLDTVEEKETSDITGATSITSAYANKRVKFTAAATATLAAAGDFSYKGCVAFRIRDAAEAAVIDVQAAEKINLSGTALSAGTAITATGAGETVVMCPTTDSDGSGTDGWEAWGPTTGWASE